MERSAFDFNKALLPGLKKKLLNFCICKERGKERERDRQTDRDREDHKKIRIKTESFHEIELGMSCKVLIFNMSQAYVNDI